MKFSKNTPKEDGYYWVKEKICEKPDIYHFVNGKFYVPGDGQEANRWSLEMTVFGDRIQEPTLWSAGADCGGGVEMSDKEIAMYDEPTMDAKENTFTIGFRTPATKQVCKTCGGDKFEVGFGEYFTAIRCTTCKYQCCVHEG